MRSFNFLLEEKKLGECDLLGEKYYTDDSYYPKYSQWTNVPVPRSHVDSLAVFFPEDLESHSPPPVSLVERTPAEQEGMDCYTMSLWSPTLLRIEPYRLVNFPRNPDHNFMIWFNVDLLVRRNDTKLRSFEIRYSTDEHWEWLDYQYHSNEWRDLSDLSPNIYYLPLIPFDELASEHTPEHSLVLNSPSQDLYLHILSILSNLLLFIRPLTFVSFADTMKAHLKDLVSRKPRTKKSVPEGEKKRKTPADPTKEKSHEPEHGVSTPEPKTLKKSDVQKKLNVSKKSEAPKLNGIIFKEPAPQEQAKTLPALVEGKGKGKFTKPLRPTKKPKAHASCGVKTDDPRSGGYDQERGGSLATLIAT